MTRLSFTLRLMPHCWPQKQQCVATSLSGTAPVSALAPSMRLRCGPQALASASSDLGSVAICFPEPPLRDGEHRAPAGGTDALVVVEVREGEGAGEGKGKGKALLPATRGEGAAKRRMRGAILQASPLIRRCAVDGVVVSELPLDVDQIFNLQQRRVLLRAARALRHPFLRRHVLVEADAELRGALEDVEELPERQIEQRED